MDIEKLKIQKEKLESEVAVLSIENNHRIALMKDQDDVLKGLDGDIDAKRKDLESERDGLVKERKALDVASGKFKATEKKYLDRREALDAREISLNEKDDKLVALGEDLDERGARTRKDEKNATDVVEGLSKGEDKLVAKELRLEKKQDALELREKNLSVLEADYIVESEDLVIRAGAFKRECEGLGVNRERMVEDLKTLEAATEEYYVLVDTMADKKIEAQKEAVRLQEERKALEDIAESIKLKQGSVAKGEIALDNREKEAEARDLDLNLKEAKLLQRNKKLEVRVLAQKG